MSIKENLTNTKNTSIISKSDLGDYKNKIDLLLDYANGVTEKGDTNIGDAIKTLADGYGQGGDDIADSIVSRTIEEYINDKITSIGAHAFRDCSKMTTFICKNARQLGLYCFYNCDKLKYVDVGFASIGSALVFNSNSSLETLILRKTTVDTLANANRIPTNVTTGTCFVYVPDELVESYKTANIWSTVASQIKPLSEVEN